MQLGRWQRTGGAVHAVGHQHAAQPADMLASLLSRAQTSCAGVPAALHLGGRQQEGCADHGASLQHAAQRCAQQGPARPGKRACALLPQLRLPPAQHLSCAVRAAQLLHAHPARRPRS